MSAFTLRLPDSRPGVIRVAVKDIIDMAGQPTTSGSAVLAERAQPATADAACLAGIRAAAADGRAAIVGRTNLHELAFGITGINPWFGTPVNPIDPDRVPGGSSSGSAVVVADGEADIALGTDTGGSIRIPAACCGIVGLKTTYGRVPLTGVGPLAPSFDTVGPMAADVATTGLGMQLLEPGFSWTGVSPAVRIGRFRARAEPWVDAAVDGALAAYGAEIVEIALPGWPDATEHFSTILMAEAWRVHRDLLESDGDRLSPDVAARLVAGSRLAEPVIASARRGRAAWREELGHMLATVDVIALPVLGDEPVRISEGARLSELRHTGPFNLAGVPALALPVPGGRRFPASLQLVGPHGAEAALLVTAAAIEAAVGG